MELTFYLYFIYAGYNCLISEIRSLLENGKCLKIESLHKLTLGNEGIEIIPMKECKSFCLYLVLLICMIAFSFLREIKTNFRDKLCIDSDIVNKY